MIRELFSRGYQISVLDNLMRGVNDPFVQHYVDNMDLKIIKADLLDYKSLEKIGRDFTYVYHFAAIIGVSHVLEKPYTVLADNAKMTDNIIRFCKKQKILRRLIFSSTSEVYAGSLLHLDMRIPTPETTPIALTDIGQPRTSYMMSKLYGEALCAMSGLPITILRLHNIYGPRMGMAHVIPELLKKVWRAGNGESLEIVSFDHSRTFCYVTDAVRMIADLSECDKAVGRTINVGNDRPEISIGKLAQIILDTVDKNLILIPRGGLLGSPSRRCPDIHLLQELVDIKPSVSLEQGIELTFDWYRENVFECDGISAE